MSTQLLDVLSWTAVFMVLLSLISSSFFYKRWFGLLGALCFVLYAWELSLTPLLAASSIFFIGFAWHLFRLYTVQVKEYFQRFPIDPDNTYLRLFLEFYKDELKQIYASYSIPHGDDVICFFILRNMIPAGVFIASEMEPQVLYVHVDFAIPQHRDYKIAKFMYEQQADFFLEQGYTSLWTISKQMKHTSYLNKMGFKARSIEGRVYYVKDLVGTHGAAAAEELSEVPAGENADVMPVSQDAEMPGKVAGQQDKAQ
ncbi:MAG: hypothetical protein SCK57_14715 [Bacillota bacterium]|nr:hypothetical protein [Bacillota bacterium]MDW7678901.1 hypothetical protein [Bacillota bacterium]